MPLRSLPFVFLLLTGRLNDLNACSLSDSLITAPAEPITKVRFVADTDQRFFFFRTPFGDRSGPDAFNIWGIRAGLLFPRKYKLGLGYYVGRQLFSRPGIVPEPYTRLTRRLSYLTAYYEPYLFRRKFWELSVPVEAGFGTVRYDSFNYPNQARTRRRGYFVPTGAALSLSLKFPELRRLRALRWFGVNFIGGYRVVPYVQSTDSQLGYNGFFYSISPAFFLDRFTVDYKKWRARQKTSRPIE
ncbi:hypothetical protein [Tellurirhabdus rosea]|uniref:hypothetical protein n=1 Tax=Tellurirhabdus rosea TaxID=2674997 RepID=UPI00225A492C|nr:hypothetical protein [Tellurirhabdus rosea]